MGNLVLTGFMGTGKTTVGCEAARRLARTFVDMDVEIEARAGKSIPRIFKEDGEAVFRQLEAELCRELSERSGLVIATGGGALVDLTNRAVLSKASTLVCLSASPDAIVDRVRGGMDRPLLSDTELRADIERLLSVREEAYAAIPWQVSTTGVALADVVDRVLALDGVRTLPVAHPAGAYDIHIGQGTLGYLGGALRAAGVPAGTRIAVVTNDVVGPLYSERVRVALDRTGFSSFSCILPDGEGHKTSETVRLLYDQLLDGDLDRGDTVLALGGGVTGDIAGFAAATYMRGVRFVQVPTSLLAMTDASVGAKTGVDLPQGKNLVGAFKQPALVFADLAVLETLSPEELRSGLAEVIKHGIIGDPELFGELAAALRAGAAQITTDILARSIQVKIGIVQDDPFERGQRAVLNLGHTAGHALERLSNYTMRHGEAVSIGMVVATRIAEAMRLTERGLSGGISQVLASAGLPVRCPPRPAGDIWRAMRHDKKRQGKNLRWVLPTDIGHVEIRRDVPEELVRSVLLEMGAR